MYKWIVLKRKIESILISPFILLGQLVACFQKSRDFEIYFFFPFYHVGGAEKIHYQIAQAFKGRNCIIYFTKKSKGENFLAEFKKAGFEIRNISGYTDNKLLYFMNFIFRGIISFNINRQKSGHLVFNGQSNFGYKISPWISRSVPQVDLIHAMCSFSTIRIPFLEFYRKSLTVSKEIVDRHEALYTKYKVPLDIINNLQYINYGIELPPKREKHYFPDSLRCLYVGRGSEEKRIHLIAKIASETHNLGLNIQFNFLGDVSEFIPLDLKSHCKFYGTITDIEKVDQIYRENDILLVTSYTESGPLVVLEAMARGLCILSTPVGIINEHIVSGKNGFVFSTIENETLIIEEAINFITFLSKEKRVLQKIAKENIEYAYSNFSIELFKEKYRNLLQILNSSR